MSKVKYHYDQEADVLYVSFGHSEHATGVELAENILLRLDTGKLSGMPAKAIGLTFISFKHLMTHHQDKPLTISIDSLHNLPQDLWQATMAVITSSPVSDFLNVGLSLSPRVPPLPELVTTYHHLCEVRGDVGAESA
ncbi:MAG: DUF2283 domain-containing protein [bacterium]|nr:DUF2283 domain-containing protein [bacterium]